MKKLSRKRHPHPGDQRLWLTLTNNVTGKELKIGYAYRRHILQAHPESLLVHINRHELPEGWRTLFRMQAIQICATVHRDAEGLYRLKKSHTLLRLKAVFIGQVEYHLDDGAEQYHQDQTEKLKRSRPVVSGVGNVPTDVT